MNPISQMKLKEVLEYCPNTGQFTWKEKVADKVNIGSRAGSLAKSGYRFIRLFGKRYREHQLACLYMLGYFPPQVDHEDHVRSNNVWGNLQPTDYAGNGKNHPKTVRNKTGAVGVSLRPDGKYIARIYVNMKHVFIGVFDDVQSAAAARAAANVQHGFHVNHGK